MTDINDLRERVEAAEERFGLLDEQQRHYSERVIGLIEAIEAQPVAARGEIEKQIDENLQLGQDLAAARSEIELQVDANLRLSQENQELRSEEHTSELQYLMRSSYADLCLKKKKTTQNEQK